MEDDLDEMKIYINLSIISPTLLDVEHEMVASLTELLSMQQTI